MDVILYNGKVKITFIKGENESAAKGHYNNPARSQV